MWRDSFQVWIQGLKAIRRASGTAVSQIPGRPLEPEDPHQLDSDDKDEAEDLHRSDSRDKDEAVICHVLRPPG